MGNFNLYLLEIQIDSASPASFIKKDLLHERNITDRFIPIHQLSEVKLRIDQLVSEGYIEKFWRCSKDCFISPIAITAKRDGSIKLALNWKLLNKPIFCNIYQKPKLFELTDNVVLTISGHNENLFWFSSIDFKYAYSQMPLSKKSVQPMQF